MDTVPTWKTILPGHNNHVHGILSRGRDLANGQLPKPC